MAAASVTLQPNLKQKRFKMFAPQVYNQTGRFPSVRVMT